MAEQSDLGGIFNFPNTSMTVNRMGYGAMQLAGRDGRKWSGDLRPTFPGPSLFCARPSPQV